MRRPAPRTLPASPSAPPRKAPPRAKSRHVVVLDSDELALAALRKLLGEAGFRVSATWSLSDALALVEEERPAAFVVAERVRDGKGSAVLGAAPVLRSGCLRVLLVRDAAEARPHDADDGPRIVMTAEEAATRLAKTLTRALEARPAEPRLAQDALRERARRIVAAVCRAGYEGIDHCDRLAAWSRDLAIALDLGPSRVLDIELGAMLHDIGKIHVRDEILNRPGPLSVRERLQIQEHPFVGADLLREVPELHRAIPIVLCHHERPDGTGYPRGLARDAIPFEARIFQVVDAYEAIVTGRPWRRSRSHGEAIALMREQVEKQFDPTVLAVFERISATWGAARRPLSARGRVA